MHFVSSQGIIRLSVVKFSRPPAEHWNVQKPAWRLHLQRCARWIAEVATEVAAEVRHRKRSSEDQAEPSEAAQAAALADMRQQLKVNCPAEKGAACHMHLHTHSWTSL